MFNSALANDALYEYWRGVSTTDNHVGNFARVN